jgi:DNA-binding NarL/FixJ family response regulator
VILDVSLPAPDADSLVYELLERTPKIAVLVLTELVSVSSYVMQTRGAMVVHKSEIGRNLVPLIEVAMMRAARVAENAKASSIGAGECRATRFATEAGLTARERQIFLLLIEGLSMKQIAADLELRDGTVRRHAQNIHDKCGGRNQRELLALFADPLRIYQEPKSGRHGN